VRRLAYLVGGDARWPERLLDELGRIALLTHAFRRIDALPPLLQADVRALLGWTLTQEEVAATGEAVADDWVVVGQWVQDEERVRIQRSWLVGARSSRRALVLQFATGPTAFAENLIPGTAFEGELVFWPSASPQRALIRSRAQAPRGWSRALPGFETMEQFLVSTAEAVARQPWMDRTIATFRNVLPVHGKAGRVLRDAEGKTLRLAPVDVWPLFAVSGGTPVDLAAEWDGNVLLPLGAVVDGTYHVIWKGVA
jgi:hypothetical protein